MKKIIPLFALIICFSIITEIVTAQPIITTANMPVNGDSVIIGICSDPVVPGPSGASQTWNMSTLTETQQEYFKFLPPSQTYWGYQFPNATICGKSWTNSYTYYKSNASSLEQVGVCLLLDTIAPPNDTVKSVHTDFEELLNFPFNFNNMFVDSFIGNYYAFGLTQPYTGDITVEADGYGTLILPNATYNNVVRYHFIRNQYTSFTPPQLKEQWGWISEDHRFWLLLMETDNNGFSTSNLVWYNKQPHLITGVPVIAKPRLAIYPNPVKLNEKFFIKWERTEEVIVEITNVTGKVVHTSKKMMTEGNNYFDLSQDISSQGIYFLRMQNNDFTWNQKLVVLQ